MLASDMRWRVAIALVYFTAGLSSGADDPSESCPGEQLCGEGAGTASTEKSDIISLVSHTGTPNQDSRSGCPGATRRKRSRRTGFSYEDVAADKSFQPLLALFRDSLSGRGREKLNYDEPGVLSGPRSSADPFHGSPTASSREKGEEVGIRSDHTRVACTLLFLCVKGYLSVIVVLGPNHFVFACGLLLLLSSR